MPRCAAASFNEDYVAAAAPHESLFRWTATYHPPYRSRLNQCYNQSHNTASYLWNDAEKHVPACDLEQRFRAVADQLPEADTASLVLSTTILPQLPSQLTTDQLVIRAGRHSYHSYTHTCVDELHFQAHKRTYRLLGLAFLAKVFHSEPREVHIRLTNPHSPVRTLVLDYDQAEGWNLVPGYDKRPYQYIYEPQPVAVPPALLRERFFPTWLLPVFTLTNATKVAGPCEDWDIRDTVYGAGSDYGNLLFATLLLWAISRNDCGVRVGERIRVWRRRTWECGNTAVVTWWRWMARCVVVAARNA